MSNTGYDPITLEKVTRQAVVNEVFFEMPKEFNLYTDFFPAVEKRCEKYGMKVSQSGITATMRKCLYYTIVNKSTGAYRKVV